MQHTGAIRLMMVMESSVSMSKRPATHGGDCSNAVSVLFRCIHRHQVLDMYRDGPTYTGLCMLRHDVHALNRQTDRL